MKDLGLKKEQVEMIRQTIAASQSVDRAVIFGSRAKGTHRYNSDIDIAIYGDTDDLTAEAVADELDELPMPYKFDVLSYDGIMNAELRAHIDRVGIEIFKR